MSNMKQLNLITVKIENEIFDLIPVTKTETKTPGFPLLIPARKSEFNDLMKIHEYESDQIFNDLKKLIRKEPSAEYNMGIDWNLLTENAKNKAEFAEAVLLACTKTLNIPRPVLDSDIFLGILVIDNTITHILDGCAKNAGLQVNDEILSFNNDTNIQNLKVIKYLSSVYKIGDHIPFRIKRNNTEMEVNVILTNMHGQTSIGSYKELTVIQKITFQAEFLISMADDKLSVEYDLDGDKQMFFNKKKLPTTSLCITSDLPLFFGKIAIQQKTVDVNSLSKEELLYMIGNFEENCTENSVRSIITKCLSEKWKN